MSRTLLILCTFGAMCILGSCGMRSTQYVGDHRVSMIDTHVSEKRSSLEARPDGTPVFTYESDEIKVRLEGEVLTVNGRRYIIPKKNDSITIKNGHVRINGRPARAEVEEDRDAKG